MMQCVRVWVLIAVLAGGIVRTAAQTAGEPLTVIVTAPLAVLLNAEAQAALQEDGQAAGIAVQFGANPPAAQQVGVAEIVITVDAGQQVTITPRTVVPALPSPLLRVGDPLWRWSLTADDPRLVGAVRGMIFAAGGQCAAAANALADVPEAAPYIANCWLAVGDRDAGLQIYGAVFASDADYRRAAGFAGNYAWALLQAEDTAASAFAVMDRALAANPAAEVPRTHADLLAGRAYLHAITFAFDPAIADISAAIALIPDDAAYYKQRGDHIFLIYEWDRVLADYDRAIALDPDYAEAYFARGVLYYTQGPRPRALLDFERFVELAAADDPVRAEAQTYIDAIQIELQALSGE